MPLGAGLDPQALITMLAQGQQPGVPGQISPILQSLLAGGQQGQNPFAAQPGQQSLEDRLKLIMQGLGPIGVGALRGV